MFNECLFHLCDCTCSNVMCILNCLSIKPKSIFLSIFYMFLIFYTFVCLEFLFKISISCFYQKNLPESFSRVSRELALPAKMTMAKIGKHWISDKKFWDYLARNIYPQNSLHASVAFSRVILREAYLQKALVFSFKR